MNALYMVATPIGNFGDITFRALEVLKQVDVVACEDTRRTGKLLNHFGISTRMIACHAWNEQASAQGIVNLLDQGRDIAYVSDAGTPGISDPGSRLVNLVRSEGYPVIPVPGVSALTAAASVCSFLGKSVLFEGFLSPKAGKKSRRIAELLEREEAFVLYESPHRLVKTLGIIAEAAPRRRVLVGREMTKLHEEYIEDAAEAVHRQFAERQSVKGECVICVSPAEPA